MTPKTIDQMSDDDIEKFIEFVRRLASMPNIGETMHSTWRMRCTPTYDDSARWWEQFVTEARKLTGVTYKVTP